MLCLKNNVIKNTDNIIFFLKKKKLYFYKNTLAQNTLKLCFKVKSKKLSKGQTNRINTIIFTYKRNQKVWISFKNIVLGPHQILFLNDIVTKSLRKDLITVKLAAQLLNSFPFKKTLYFTEFNLRSRFFSKKLTNVDFFLIKILWKSFFFKKKRIKKWLQKKYTQMSWR